MRAFHKLAIRSLAAMSAVVSIGVLVTACGGPAVGDPCESGSDCGDGQFCLDTPAGATCQEIPAACGEDPGCDCEEMLDECETTSSVCLAFGSDVTVSCSE